MEKLPDTNELVERILTLFTKGTKVNDTPMRFGFTSTEGLKYMTKVFIEFYERNDEISITIRNEDIVDFLGYTAKYIALSYNARLAYDYYIDIVTFLFKHNSSYALITDLIEAKWQEVYELFH